ncbi:MAG: type II toxin-antitoxin system HicA family toxin [Spirochaetales bacterium]|nr:type II toxin-antitoxin system HicA family toxin [Spirochaetales bacterium]
MNRKNKSTLAAIFEDPVRSDISWADIESLLYAEGAEITEGRGSRIRIALKDVRAVFHRPHPRKVMDKGSVKSIRRFLIVAGVKDVEV